MSYEWGNDTMPTPPFDGQLHVDSTGVIREYVAAIGAWRDRGDYKFVQSMSQIAPLNSRLVGADFWVGGILSKASNAWDSVYDKTFVKLTWTSSNTVQYVAHVTHAELRAWIAANGPQSAGRYDSDVLIEAMEVVSPEMRITRVMSMHRLYGSMRGRKSYQGRFGRKNTDNGINGQSGYGTRFEGYWTGGNTMAIDLVNRVYSQVPPTNDSNVIWFPCDKPTSRYRAGVNIYLGNGANGRMVWNVNTSSYQTAPAGAYVEDTSVSDTLRPTWAVVQEPAGNSFTFVGRSDQEARGSSWLWDRTSMMLLLPMVHANFTDMKCFLAYPIGVTHVTFRLPQAIGQASDFIVDNHYDNSSQSTYRWKLSGSVENPTPDTFRVGLADAMRLLGGPGDTQRRSLDFEGIPSRMQFFIRNPVTGLRSEHAGREIVKVMRKKHMSLGFFEKAVVS